MNSCHHFHSDRFDPTTEKMMTSLGSQRCALSSFAFTYFTFLRWFRTVEEGGPVRHWVFGTIYPCQIMTYHISFIAEEWMNDWINHWMNQSMNQSMNLSINQSISTFDRKDDKNWIGITMGGGLPCPAHYVVQVCTRLTHTKTRTHTHTHTRIDTHA